MSPLELLSRLSRRLRLRVRPPEDEPVQVLATASGGSATVEEFNLLALNVLTMLEGVEPKTVAVFGSGPNGDHSYVALNLGYALARHTDVFLVSDRWRDPNVRGAIEGAARPIHELSVVSDERALALTEKSLLDCADAAAGQYVILDGPSASVSSDAFLIAQRARNVIYVLPDGVTELDSHERHLQQLRRLNANVLGIVVAGS